MSAEIPLALIGIGCKFPGKSDTKDLYYEFLRNKVSFHSSLWFAFSNPFSQGDGMIQPPLDRWDHANWHG